MIIHIINLKVHGTLLSTIDARSYTLLLLQPDASYAKCVWLAIHTLCMTILSFLSL